MLYEYLTSPLHLLSEVVTYHEQKLQKMQQQQNNNNLYYYKSILPSGPLKTKILNKNYNN